MRSFLLPALLAAALPLAAQSNFEFWPGASYDPAIPTQSKVLGYVPGERIAPHGDIVRYFEALAAAAPTRMRIVEYGRTWEGRKLIYAIIGSGANLRRIDEIKQDQQRLADPRKTSAADAQKIIGSGPAVIDLMYGVHGDEISSPDAAMMTAYHLLAAQNDPMIAGVFASVVVLIDPLQNPDGRGRFIQNFRASEGLEPDPNPSSAERAQPWPGGRTNHYLFDMNRDWHALTQPETRGRVRYFNEWLPLIVVDLHEMGTDSTYFFSPGAAPFNPHLTKEQKEEMYWFGQNNAKWFDQFGYPYFTREVFDEFYSGYGAARPWYYGALGMTYENASVRGLIARRSDDTLYTYRESVKKHFVASISTCETAARYREKLLSNFWLYNQTAVAEGAKEDVKEYIIPRRGDVSAVDKLAGLLADQSIEVQRATAAFRSGGKDYPAGSYVISLAQPRKRMIRTFLDPDVSMESSFVKEQERRRRKKLPDEIYDVTAWSLPLQYNVECVSAKEASAGNFEMVQSGKAPAGKVSGTAEVAYLVPWGTQASARFMSAALRADLKVSTTNKAFTQNGTKYPAGTLIVLVKQNPPSVHELVAKFAAESGAEVAATNTSWVEDGVNFGSNNVTVLKKPAIAMLWDSPASSSSAGATRFVLERQYGYPVTVIRGQVLGRADLSKFQVLILPDGGYSSVLSGATLDRVKAWVRAGGVIVALGDAIGALSTPQAGLLNVQQENLAREGAKDGTKEGAKEKALADAAKPAAAGAAPTPAAADAAGGPVPGKLLTKPEDYEKAILADKELPDSVAGVLVRVKVEPELWITAGLPETLNALVNGRTIYSPIKQDKGVNAAYFAGPDELVASGYLWEENRKQLAYKPFVIVQEEGRGQVIGFTADPNFRAYMDGLNIVFLNAVFRGPVASRLSGDHELRVEKE